MQSTIGLRDAFVAALDMARELPASGGMGIVGYGVAHLIGPDGETKQLVPFANLITDVGDMYYATKGIAAVPPASPGNPTAISGMQIGLGVVAVSKSGAGAAMGTLSAGQVLDASYPQTNNLGAGLGVEAVYKCTYAAGTGTGTITEATLTNTATLGTGSTAALTVSRVLTGSIPKASTDSLAITWRHKFLGA